MVNAPHDLLNEVGGVLKTLCVFRRHAPLQRLAMPLSNTFDNPSSAPQHVRTRATLHAQDVTLPIFAMMNAISVSMLVGPMYLRWLSVYWVMRLRSDSATWRPKYKRSGTYM